jgi:hypothetical protein
MVQFDFEETAPICRRGGQVIATATRAIAEAVQCKQRLLGIGLGSHRNAPSLAD